MARSPYFYATTFGAGVLATFGLTLLLVPGLVRWLFTPGMFMPHAHCYLNDPRMLMLQGVSDGLIGLAYMGISATLAYMVYRARKDIPFEWMFLAFGVFIFTCGWTHFLEVWTLWHPTYWLSGGVKALTAAASVATAIGVPPLLPRIFSLIEIAKASETRKRELERAQIELESLNRQLRELDQLKSDFFANVSHELRTPLTLILGSMERLITAENITSDQQDALRAIRRNSDTLLKHVTDLLDASKLDAGKMGIKYQEFDLAKAVRLVTANFNSMAQDRGMRFTVVGPDSLLIQADAEKVERVLTNLLSNAFKFAPPQGKVWCEIKETERDVSIEVGDNGPGIPEQHRQTVFDRFRQLDAGMNRSFGGTGLGLAIVREFVLLHGGSVTVGQSAEGGALFTVRLPRKAPDGVPVRTLEKLQQLEVSPVAEPRAAITTAIEAPQPTPPDAPTILVVEDNVEMNQLICRSLAPNYQSICVLDAHEGLAKLRTSRVDLILTDMMMPKMSGDEFVKAVRQDPAMDKVPIVVLTAKADNHSRVHMLRAGAQDYLLKPFTQEELRARAGNLIASKRYREELERAYKEQEAFSYSLAHDMRGPLRSINMFAHILIEDHGPSLPEEAKDQVDKMISSARRLERLINDVLGYTRLARSPIEPRPVDLNALIQELRRAQAELQEPKAQIVIVEPLPPVLGDQGSLTQIISNLLSNGVKFVAPGLTPRIEISHAPSDIGVRVSFKDNGIGIEPKDQDRIFNLFERVHSRDQYEGTGLGLAIVKKAVERMGGRIGVNSAPGQGSEFWLELRAVND